MSDDIFFLDPDYAEYKIGRKIKLETLYPYAITSRPKYATRPLINLPYLLFLLLGFGSCVTAPSWFLALSDHLELSALSGEAQAQVISCEESQVYRSGITANLELTYDYPVSNPNQSGRQRINTTAKQPCPETGALIAIRYNLDNPRAVKVINPNED